MEAGHHMPDINHHLPRGNKETHQNGKDKPDARQHYKKNTNDTHVNPKGGIIYI